jgi:uncharacterized protein (DUF983 family)
MARNTNQLKLTWFFGFIIVGGFILGLAMSLLDVPRWVAFVVAGVVTVIAVPVFLNLNKKGRL